MLGVKNSFKIMVQDRENDEQALWHHIDWDNWSTVLWFSAGEIYGQRQVRDLKKMKELFLLCNMHLQENCAVRMTHSPTQCWFHKHSHFQDTSPIAHLPNQTGCAHLVFALTYHWMTWLCHVSTLKTYKFWDPSVKVILPSKFCPYVKEKFF